MTAVTARGHGRGSTTVKVVALPIRFSGRNVNPVVTGPAMPQHIEINRAGLRRVRVTVAPS